VNHIRSPNRELNSVLGKRIASESSQRETGLQAQARCFGGKQSIATNFVARAIVAFACQMRRHEAVRKKQWAVPKIAPRTESHAVRINGVPSTTQN